MRKLGNEEKRYGNKSFLKICLTHACRRSQEKGRAFCKDHPFKRENRKLIQTANKRWVIHRRSIKVSGLWKRVPEYFCDGTTGTFSERPGMQPRTVGQCLRALRFRTKHDQSYLGHYQYRLYNIQTKITMPADLLGLSDGKD